MNLTPGDLLMFQQNVGTEINILTGVMGVGTLILSGLLAYIKVSMSNSLSQMQMKINKDMAEGQQKMMLEIKQEFARKELIDSKLGDMERRVGKIEAGKEARIEARTEARLIADKA